MANLITAYEVKRYSPAGRNYPEVNICEAIPQVEEGIGYKCLGEDLYEWLITKLTAYPATVQEYDPTIEYSEDEYVVRHGCLFVSEVGCNRTDPVEVENDWAAVDKFTDACANTLWTRYLRRILALRVYETVMLYDTQQSGAGGVVVSLGDGYNTGHRAASKGEIADRAKRLDEDANLTVQNMYRWFEKQLEDKTCTTMPINSAQACWQRNCEQPRKGIRRFAFKY
jgi:hypothetical protein